MNSNDIYVISLLILSGISAGLFGFGYKKSMHVFSSAIHFLLYYAASFGIAAILGKLAFNEKQFQLEVFYYGIPNGICMFVAIFFYYNLISTTQLNISWTVLQFSIFIPVFLSIILFDEPLELLSVIGFVLMVMALLCFGKGKAKRNPNKRAPISIKLLMATVFSGLAASFPKLYNAQTDIVQPYTLLTVSSATMMLLVLFSYMLAPSSIRRIPDTTFRKRIFPPLSMAVFQLISMATLTFALSSISGSTAYPFRSLTSLLTVYVIAFALLKESLNSWELIGITFSMAAFWCITYVM